MKRAGFTLVELMIVVAIISSLSAISVPMLLRARVQAKETQVIAFMHSYHTAQVQFITSNKRDKRNDGSGDFGFFKDLATAPPGEVPFIEGMDLAIMRGKKGAALYGYRFASKVVNGNKRREPWYELRARPVKKRLGGRGFFIDATGVIRYTRSGAFPNASSPAL